MPHQTSRSFACIELYGFADFVDRRGDEAAATALLTWRALVRHATEEHGVRVVAWLGARVMLMTAAPARLDACLEHIWHAHPQTAELAARGGRATGPTRIFEGDDYLGRPVSDAERRCLEAAAGELRGPPG